MRIIVAIGVMRIIVAIGVMSIIVAIGAMSISLAVGVMSITWFLIKMFTTKQFIINMSNFHPVATPVTTPR
jgi:hypothetical protein